jgi:hypothetical protein
MKIKKEDIREIFGLLSRSGLSHSNDGKAFLFFPFEQKEKIEETESGVVLLEANDNKYGSKKLVKPGFIIDETGVFSDGPSVAYVSDEYSVPFSLKEHMEEFCFVENELTPEEKERLYSLDCLLVREQQVLAAFKY